MALGTIAAIIGGSLAASALSGHLNSVEASKTRQFNADQAKLTRDYNSAEAVKAREFDKTLSDTSYQRAVQDANAAGLNVGSIGAGLQGASTTHSNAASSAVGASNAQGHFDFSGVVQNAMFAAMASSKLVNNKVIQEMKNANALDVAYTEKKIKSFLASKNYNYAAKVQNPSQVSTGSAWLDAFNAANK